MKHLNRVIYCCDIAYQVNIPETTLLPHQGMGVVMHPKTVIGNNCIIFQHTTFGASHGDGESDAAPILGDSVMVGVGATLLGAIKVGNNVTIGAHSVVINDVPDNAVVAGIPAVIKKYKSIEEKKQ
ncbi:serine O-acetyltransferase [Butyrivibrio sp. AE2015]|uniref:serine O-acetyltransferase n=1 Tax=Butyrivibrio sp. AE2015 TaxID=1280663 RepID=UPI0012DC8F3D|nr:serine acetyltransferase [Butyrivibrio sp. AE2015]